MSIAHDVARLQAQEDRLVFSHFDEDAAFAVGTIARDMAIAANQSIVLDVSLWDRRMFYFSMVGKTPDNPEWVRRKANVVRRFMKSSYAVGREISAGTREFGPAFGIDIIDYAPNGGAFPIRVRGAGLIGAITVSGLTEREDHEHAVGAICKHLGISHADIALA